MSVGTSDNEETRLLVVVGSPIAVRDPGEVAVPGGLAARIAVAAARAGATVQLVGKLGDDQPGDEVLLGLATAGVGHVALVRDPANSTPFAISTGALEADDPQAEPADPRRVPPGLTLEPADVDLALKYLTDFRVISVVEPQPQGVTAVVVEAAAYVGATMIAITGEGDAANLPDGAIVLAEPADGDPDGAFATFVGLLAAAIDAGATPADAFARVSAEAGVTPTA